MPYEDVDGIGFGSVVVPTGEKLTIRMGEGLIGRTVDAIGNPLDDGPPIEGDARYSINGTHSNPMNRPPISQTMQIGVKAIDGLLTIGKGQRMGIFAGSGVGKSTLMGMIARNIKADVNVIALVGERGREVVEFINRDLGPEGIKRSVLVVATSDTPAMMRSKCALTATAIAEYFRDQGKDVLLMMDSLTRFCMAQREIGLSIGEPPVARGYTPSIYSALPKLLERSGNFECGSITGIYTVLVEGDDTNEPISDTVRAYRAFAAGRHAQPLSRHRRAGQRQPFDERDRRARTQRRCRQAAQHAFGLPGEPGPHPDRRLQERQQPRA